MSKFSNDEIKAMLGKYGQVFLPEDIHDNIDELIGLSEQKEMMSDFFSAVDGYAKLVEHLRSVGIAPSLTMLLYGPPGTGKTSLTRAFAKNYEIPIVVVEADRLVSSLLGETMKQVSEVFSAAAKVAEANGKLVLFFDEIDAIASERSNANDVAEIKRAVISFLQHIDTITYKGIPLIIIGATNHQKQLDSAAWRRFTFHLYFGFPNPQVRYEILSRYVKKLEKVSQMSASDSIDENIIDTIDSELAIYNSTGVMPEGGLLRATDGYTGADIERGCRVALFRLLATGRLELKTFIDVLQHVGGTQTHVEQQDYLAKKQIAPEKSMEDSKSRPKKNAGIKENDGFDILDLD